MTMKSGIVEIPTGRVFHSAIPSPLGSITWAGRHLDQDFSKAMPLRRWDIYSAVYVLKGHGRFQDEAGLNLPLKPGDLILMFPRHGYRYHGNKNEPWSEFFVQFRGPIFSLWAREGLLNRKQPIHHLEPIDHWWSRLEATIKPMTLPEPAQSLKRVCLLQEFLVDAVLTPQGESDPNDQRWLARVRALIELNPGKAIDWDATARTLGITYHHLRRKFTQLSGVPPARHRAACVVRFAEDLLHDSSLSMKEIARKCGFCDEFHFSRRFKLMTGLTPADFRRRLN